MREPRSFKSFGRGYSSDWPHPKSPLQGRLDLSNEKRKVPERYQPKVLRPGRGLLYQLTPRRGHDGRECTEYVHTCSVLKANIWYSPNKGCLLLHAVWNISDHFVPAKALWQVGSFGCRTRFEKAMWCRCEWRTKAGGRYICMYSICTCMYCVTSASTEYAVTSRKHLTENGNYSLSPCGIRDLPSVHSIHPTFFYPTSACCTTETTPSLALPLSNLIPCINAGAERGDWSCERWQYSVWCISLHFPMPWARVARGLERLQLTGLRRLTADCLGQAWRTRCTTSG